MRTGSAWQPRGGRSALTLSPALCQPVWAVSCPSATAAQREPRDKGPLCGGSSQRAGAGWSVCVNILRSLGKPPHPRPPGPQSFVCQGHNGDLQNACPGTTAGERVAEGGQGRLGGRRKARHLVKNRPLKGKTWGWHQKTAPWYGPKALPSSLTRPPGSYPPPHGQPASLRTPRPLASQPSCSHLGGDQRGSS